MQLAQPLQEKLRRPQPRAQSQPPAAGKILEADEDEKDNIIGKSYEVPEEDFVSAIPDTRSEQQRVDVWCANDPINW